MQKLVFILKQLKVFGNGKKQQFKKKGGCKDHQLQEKLDEFAFRKTYLKDPNTNLIFVANVIVESYVL